MKLSNELKTGAVVVAALLVGAYFFLKTAPLQAKTYTLKALFTYAEGIKQDAVVRLSGIDVGRVTGVDFKYLPETRVEVIMEIDTNAKVRADSIAFIGTTGFVGDAYVGLTPGEADTFLASGKTVQSEDPVQMRLLMKKAESIANNLDQTINEVKSLAGNFNGMINDNRQGIDKIVINLENITDNFNEFSADIKRNPWKLLFKGKEEDGTGTAERGRR